MARKRSAVRNWDSFTPNSTERIGGTISTKRNRWTLPLTWVEVSRKRRWTEARKALTNISAIMRRSLSILNTSTVTVGRKERVTSCQSFRSWHDLHVKGSRERETRFFWLTTPLTAHVRDLREFSIRYAGHGASTHTSERSELFLVADHAEPYSDRLPSPAPPHPETCIWIKHNKSFISHVTFSLTLHFLLWDTVSCLRDRATWRREKFPATKLRENESKEEGKKKKASSGVVVASCKQLLSGIE